MTDIVERLRGLAKDWLVRYDGIHEPLNEAADEIERLREALRDIACDCELKKEISWHEEENSRLREALHTIFCNTEPDAIKHRDYDHLAKNICEVARAALEEKE